MKIYFIPYSLRVYLSDTVFHSGIDMSMMSNMSAVKSLGHECRVFCLAGDFDREKTDAFIFNPTLRNDEIKAYYKIRRKQIYEAMYADIIDYQPDVILSNHIVCPIYRDLVSKIDLPIVIQNHLVPGFFTDLVNANLYSELSERSVSTYCVSDYSRKRFEKYYSKAADGWNFIDIKADGVLYPACVTERKTAKESDGVIRHVSALNPGKKTFIIHEFLEETEIKTEVYTTMLYLSSTGDKVKNYAEKNIKRFQDEPLRKTIFDLPHEKIMDAISNSMCTFVGLAPYDTYTITSLESLQRGVPLILFGNRDGDHPALEILDAETRNKFIRVVRNKDQFLSAVQDFSKLTLADRQELADKTYEFNSIEKTKSSLELIFKKSILKHQASEDVTNIERFMNG